MERRTAIKYLFVIAAGAAVLPSCVDKTTKSSIFLKHLDISADDEQLLAEIAETIIPAGASPGAKDTYAHLFTLKMLDGCYEVKDQKAFVKGMKQVNDLSKEKFRHSFVKCSIQQRNEILNALESKAAPQEAVAFYKIMKAHTVQGYLGSKPVLGGILHYELVPGRYNGFFPFKTTIHQV